VQKKGFHHFKHKYLEGVMIIELKKKWSVSLGVQVPWTPIQAKKYIVIHAIKAFEILPHILICNISLAQDPIVR